MNPLTTHFIDRVSDKRRDAEWLAALQQDQMTRFIPVWSAKNLFTTGEGTKPLFLNAREAQDFTDATESPVFLGTNKGHAYFAIDLSAQEPPADLAERGRFQELRRMAAALDNRDAALLAYANAMIHWHARQRFCGSCGSPTTSAEGGYLQVCTDKTCRQQHFPRVDPAIIVLVTAGERCLLGRQPVWPEGLYSTIAGFVEPGESLESAVVREVQEETSIGVAHVCYHSSQPWPFPSSLMLGFTAQAQDETICVNKSELQDARWFTRETIQRELDKGVLKLPSPYSIAHRLIQDWLEGF